MAIDIQKVYDESCLLIAIFISLYFLNKNTQQTDRRTHRQIDTQTDRQAHRQIDSDDKYMQKYLKSETPKFRNNFKKSDITKNDKYKG